MNDDSNGKIEYQGQSVLYFCLYITIVWLFCSLTKIALLIFTLQYRALSNDAYIDMDQ